MFGFTFQDVVREFPDMVREFPDMAREFPEKNRVHLARILAEMVEKGMLFKIIRDIGCLRRQVSLPDRKRIRQSWLHDNCHCS